MHTHITLRRVGIAALLLLLLLLLLLAGLVVEGIEGIGATCGTLKLILHLALNLIDAPTHHQSKDEQQEEDTSDKDKYKRGDAAQQARGTDCQNHKQQHQKRIASYEIDDRLKK